MKIIKTIALIALFLIALALGSQNQDMVTFNYLVAQGQFHLSSLLGVIFVLGFAFAGVFAVRAQFQSKLQIRRLKKQLKKLQPNTTISQASASKVSTDNKVSKTESVAVEPTMKKSS